MMGQPTNSNRPRPIFFPIANIRQLEFRRSCSAQLGIALLVLGTLALVTMRPQNGGSAILSAWLVVVGGILEALQAIRARAATEFFLHMVPSIAGVPILLLMGAHPGAGVLAWMLVFASFFTFLGLFRAISAFRLKFPYWGWTAIEGLVVLLLGTLFWAVWPWGPWFFGLSVGISFVLRGWSWIVFALGAGELEKQRLHVLHPQNEEFQPTRNSRKVEVSHS